MKKSVFLKNTIRNKVFLFFICFCAVILVVLWLFQVVFLDNFYEEIKKNEVKSFASTIKKNFNNSNFSEVTDELTVLNAFSVKILNMNGQTVYSKEGTFNSIIHKLSTTAIEQLYSETSAKGGKVLGYYSPDVLEMTDERFYQPGGGVDRNFAPMPNRHKMEMIIYSEIADINGESYFIMINSEISPVDATVNTLRIQLIYITVFIVILALIISYFVAKQISTPIENINEAAKILAKGNYNVDFTTTGFNEIEELSATLNYAAVELSKVDSLRKELIANVSHDLRTPLTLIGGYAEVMRDVPSENNSENAQVIIDETKRLTTLVNHVLDMAKLENGSLPINFERMNITQLLHQVTERIQELVRNEGFVIDFLDDVKQDVYVYADEARISQVIYNLLINAINYNGEDKRVLVRQSIEGDSVKISVIDSGEGIEQENLKYIWDRYFKENKNHKRAVTGSGIGLSIVKGVVNKHGGAYGVESEIGRGSTFWFSLKILK